VAVGLVIVATPLAVGSIQARVGGSDSPALQPAAAADPVVVAVADQPAVEGTSGRATVGRLVRIARQDDSKRKPNPWPEPVRNPPLVKKEKKEKKPPEPEPGPFTVRIGSFNVLGSQHTAPGGDRKSFPVAAVRTAAAANLIAKHGVDILGTQELQDDQLRGIQARTGMAAYPGFAWGVVETDNSILWDPNVYELVTASKFTLTFMGRVRPQPIVRLRDRATSREFYVVNTHPSAGGGPYAAQRRAGQAILVGVVRNLKATGLPVFVTGDMNDREAFYCNVVPAAGLTASSGGSYSSGCRPPPGPIAVDWVVGSGATWSNYWRDTAPVTQKVSDHFFISAIAHVA
jgi:Endonuclease/Exonuclease/phosphatase family